MNFPVSLKAVFPPDKGGKGGFRGAMFPDFSNQTGIKVSLQQSERLSESVCLHNMSG